VTGALINNVPRSMLEALRDYAEQEALEHRTLMASYRPERQAYLDAQLAEINAILEASSASANTNNATAESQTAPKNLIKPTHA
jgi:hypothetical protein